MAARERDAVPPGLIEMREAIATGQRSAADLVRESLGRIETAGAALNAFVQVFHDRARQQAEAIDARIKAGDNPGPLGGVPIAVKDNICTSHGRTTCASRILERYASPYAATVVERLEAAGAVIIGKTNLDEFAMGSSGEHSCFGPTRNPWAHDRVPGGSSSGSAAAVAAGLVPAALGSDTGGSIRQPAGLCGIVGVKPTYGRVSRWGLAAFASSLDQIGTLARTVADGAVLTGVIAGFDPLDSTSSSEPVPDFLAGLDDPVPGLRLAVPTQALTSRVHPSVVGAIEEMLGFFAATGAEIVEVDLAHLADAIRAYYIVAPAEASSNLARYDGVRYGRRAEPAPGDGQMSLDDLYARSRGEGFGAEVKRRIMLGTYALSSGYYDAYYLTALKARRMIRDDLDAIFASGVHAIVMPAAPAPAFRIGEKIDDPLAMYVDDEFTVPANLAGLPAMSVPIGFAEIDGATLPIGGQIMCRHWDEPTMFRIARMHELATDWHERTPAEAG